MKVTFLKEAGNRLLSKEFARNAETGEVDSSNYYQHYHQFTSFSEVCETIEDFHSTMISHAAKGHCIVKGNYSRPLIEESRAGLVDKNQPTQWLCLDFDGADAVDCDQLLAPLGMHNVDHIVQYSASHGIKPGLRAHVYIILNAFISETQLKQWLMWLNLTNSTLKASMELTKTGNAVKWPLDISLAESHRIIYIAPPKFTDMNDPFAEGEVCGQLERIMLQKRTQRTFNITDALRQADLHTVNTLKDKQRDELRSKAGLRKKKENLKHLSKHNVYVQSNPDSATVTGIKNERGFTYLNLNGGNSWGYFHSETNFEVIHNFKGEPAYLTRDLLPDYYTECISSRKQTATNNSDLTDGSSTKYFYFTERQSGAYLKGTWIPSSETRLLDPARSREQITDFCIQHGLDEPQFIPVMETIFDPRKTKFYDPASKTVNLFQPTVYRLAVDASKASAQPPATIDKIVRHVLGDDEESYHHFINWLAFIWQTGEKPKTAWVLHGRTGTGKGTLMSMVLKPIFGAKQALEITHEPLSEKFNGYLRQTQILAIDEADTDGMPNIKAVAAKLKNWITEDYLSIREMHKGVYDARNHTAFLIFSNRQNPVLIEYEDRRISVSPRQERKLDEVMTPAEFQMIAGELQDFVNYLQAYVVDVVKATTPLENSAKQDIQLTTSSSPDDVSRAIKTGDFRYFADLLPAGMSDNLNSSANALVSIDYKKVLEHVYKQLVGNTGTDVPVRLARDDVSTLFSYALDWKSRTAKFTKAASKYGLRFTPMRLSPGEAPKRGMEIVWRASAEDLEVYRALLTPQHSEDVTPMRPRAERTRA